LDKEGMGVAHARRPRKQGRRKRHPTAGCSKGKRRERRAIWWQPRLGVQRLTPSSSENGWLSHPRFHSEYGARRQVHSYRSTYGSVFQVRAPHFALLSSLALPDSPSSLPMLDSTDCHSAFSAKSMGATLRTPQ